MSATDEQVKGLTIWITKLTIIEISLGLCESLHMCICNVLKPVYQAMIF
jgi:hypothetical protein